MPSRAEWAALLREAVKERGDGWARLDSVEALELAALLDRGGTEPTNWREDAAVREARRIAWQGCDGYAGAVDEGTANQIVEAQKRFDAALDNLCGTVAHCTRLEHSGPDSRLDGVHINTRDEHGVSQPLSPESLEAIAQIADAGRKYFSGVPDRGAGEPK